MSDLSELTKIFSGVVPSDWETKGALQPNGAYTFEWTKDGQRMGGWVFELAPGVAVILGLEANATGANVFRKLCADFPRWLRGKGVQKVVIPLAASEHAKTIMLDAGFVHVGTNTYEADISEKDSPIEVYGRSGK